MILFIFVIVGHWLHLEVLQNLSADSYQAVFSLHKFSAYIYMYVDKYK